MKPWMLFLIEVLDVFADVAVKLLPVLTLLAGAWTGFRIAKWQLKEQHQKNLKNRHLDHCLDALTRLNSADWRYSHDRIEDVADELHPAQALIDTLPEAVRKLLQQYLVAIFDDERSGDELENHVKTARAQAGEAVRHFEESDT